MPKDKMVIGLATYGRSFTLDSVSNSGLAAPTNSPGKAGKFTRTVGFLAYYEVVKHLDSVVIMNYRKSPPSHVEY